MFQIVWMLFTTLMVFGACLNNIHLIILKNTERKMSLLTMVLFVSWNENVQFLYNWCNIGLKIFCSVKLPVQLIVWQLISHNIIKVVWNAESDSAFGKHDINLSHYAVNVYICVNQHKFWNYVPLCKELVDCVGLLIY